jgi:hypothetical protein
MESGHQMSRLSSKAAIMFGSFLGVLVAVAVMHIAWKHNAHGEIHLGGEIDWAYWLLIGASWFLVSATIFSTLLCSLFAVLQKLVAPSSGFRAEK